MATLKFSLIVLLFSVLFSISYAASIDSVKDEASERHIDDYSTHKAEGFSLASNEFGLDLYRQISQVNDGHQPRENIFFSPYSISVILSMVHQGAKGQTGQQLRETLKLQTIPGVGSSSSSKSSEQSSQSTETTTSTEGGVHEIVGRAIRNVSEKLHQMEQSNRFDTGNVMIIDQTLKVRDDYIKSVKDYYDGEVIPGDFQQDGEGIKQKVNQYVSNKTHGMIDPMLEQAPGTDSRLALVNAVYFKGQWERKFKPEQIETGVFYGSNGQQYQNVQYMVTQKGEYTEMKDLNADLISLRYKNGDVTFVGVLPRERNADLTQIRQRLNSTYIDQLVEQANRRVPQATVYLPKWEVTTSYDLPEQLKQMGVQDVFTEHSDLSGISQEQKLHISRAIHKAKIVVNEDGSEAGAGTYVEIALLALPVEPPTFRFDHPFIYFIRHHQTGQILFIGEVNQF